MNPNIFFVVMLLTIGAVSSKRIRYQRCGSQARGEIILVDVTPCDQDPCAFRPGKQGTFSMKFIPRESITSAKIYANAIIKGSSRTFPVVNRDACQGYGLNCPLKAGVQAKFVFPVKLPRFSMRGEYWLEASIKDQNGNLVVCAKIDVAIA